MDGKQTRWMRFLGGRNIVFTLVVFILLAIMLLLFSYLDFVIEPIFTMISAILTPLIISFILYYLLVPVVNFFEDKGISRLWGTIILYLLIVGILGLLLIWLIPVLRDQLQSLIGAIPQLFEQVTDFITNVAQNFISTDDQRAVLQQGLDFFDNIEANFIDYLSGGFSGIGNVISSVTSTLLILLLVPIILFFFLKDGGMFINTFMEKVPPKGQKDIASILTAIDVQVGNYVKGQIAIAFVNGVLMFIGFSLIGLNYSGVLAVAGGILSFIPYLGPTLTFIPAVLVALSQSWGTVLLLIVVWFTVQFIEGNLIEPNIMGQRLDIHPLTIIFVLMIMGELLGLVGMLIGVPLYAIIKVLANFAFQKFQKRYNRYYGDEDGEYNVNHLSETYEVEEEAENLAKVDIDTKEE